MLALKAAAGVILQAQRNHDTKKELQVFATNNGIDLFKHKEQIVPGWEGQPKGLLQVLLERGLIEELLEKYTLEGRKDPITCKVDLRWSLRHILANCTDFKEEETALQYLGMQLGVTVQLTPKFHAELAGEGVKYSWAHSKSFYRQMPLSRKQGQENFKQLVKDCTCPENVLTKVRISKFAARARAHICTYHHLEHQQQPHPGVNHPIEASVAVATPVVAPKQELLYTLSIESLQGSQVCP